MSQAVTLSPEIVAGRLHALEALANDLDDLLPRLEGTHQRQGSGMWTSIASCEAFASAYANSLSGLRDQLLAVRAKVTEAGTSLRLSAAALSGVDQDTQDRLTALTDRLTAAPPAAPQVCTPYDTPAPVSPSAAVSPASGAPAAGW